MDSLKANPSLNSPPPGYTESLDGSSIDSKPTPTSPPPLLPSRPPSKSRYGSVEPRYGSVEPKNGSVEPMEPHRVNSVQGVDSVPVASHQHLSIVRKGAYGFGHVFNDLCASMWFTYLLLFFHAVLQIDNTYAGIILLIGQVADAAATPVIGFLCDKTRSRYGRRKTWHLVGTIMVAISFFFFWHNCLFCTNGVSNPNGTNLSSNCNDNTYSDNAGNTEGTPIHIKVIYFSIPIIIFQFGWASVQISHLSLIPELTENENERVGLNAIRYSATIVSNLSVFVVMFVLLETLGHSTGDDVVPGDVWIFSGTALGVIAAGCFCSLLFHAGTREPSTSAEQNDEKSNGKKLAFYKWFLNPQFYAVAVIYMCTRLMVNLTQVYIPLYLVDSLQLNKNSVAIGPLVIYVSGFLMTLLLKFFNKIIGRYMVYFIGLALIWGGLVWFWVQSVPQNIVEEVFLYGSTVLIGGGGATILVTSLSMVADLIGPAVGSGAFVYGLMSFTDKISNGIAVAVIQALHPCNHTEHVCCPKCQSFYRHVLVFVPGGASLLACVALAVLSLIMFLRVSNKSKAMCTRRTSLVVTAKDELDHSISSDRNETEQLIGKNNIVS